MKKQIFTAFCLMATALFSGCSEDKGNYDYTAVDDITIELPSSSYNVVSGGKLQIKPTLTHSIQANDLTYEWEVDGMKVSTEKDLDILLPAMSYGSKTCALIVKDNTTGMKFIKTFNIQVVGQINIGYYFLTEDAEGNGILSYLPIATDDNPNPEVIQTNACGDVQLGSNPKEIVGIYSSSAIAGYNKWSIALMSKGGQNPCILTDGTTFLPITLISESNYIDQSSGYTFTPEYCVGNMQKNVFFITDGKLVSYTKGLLYRPAKHEKEYYWSHPIPSNIGDSFFWVYDELSHKYYVIRPIDSNPALGITGDRNAYDNVIEIPNSPDLSAQSIVGTFYVRNKAHFVCSTDNQGIHVHNFTSNYSAKTYTYEGDALLPLSGANADTKALLIKDLDWYFFVGNKIYTSPVDMPKLTEYLDIPEEYGKVTAVGVSGRNSRMLVATYDENATSDLKGSILLIDIETKKITAHKHCINKCVSCLGANETPDPNYGDIGDEM